ncbi:hypothetical protein [Saccharospirillum alexandrii]|uniref:hypothetical protein n=1 Tax=Saccharospirillum alexandrii TaxID=2448477 RepID=UPI000FD746CA|nr:hypothetical protein [Saccharospirillum alexandrii]
MAKLITKWTILVCLNAVISFTFALSESRTPSEITAMVAGVVTFIGFYVALERWALQKGWNAFVLRLSIATVVKACTQFAPVLEIWAGIGAMIVVGAVFPEKGFFQAYFATLVDGFLLSLAVGVLVGLMFLVERLYRAYKANNKAA